ncbi:MAG: ribonuclease HI [Lachnospiraceae bacterium]|nr:ribonuclease HI [Lachnospiraceae bacterium]MDY5742033.1 ribonuclease HI [Lachnospiraceae bacterium]
MDRPRVTIYSDGSSRGNPGPGGYGTVVHFRDAAGELHERRFSQGFRLTTNNRMELLGLIIGMEALTKPCQVEVYSDSKYVIDAFCQNWIAGWLRTDFRRGKKNEVKNIDLWKRLLEAVEPHTVTYHWIKGHAGHPQNELCDQLATAAADGDNLQNDDGML